MISRENVEAIYPLLEKQRALEFYSLQSRTSESVSLSTSTTDPGFIQLRFVIKGPLNQSLFSRAWQSLVNRHEFMRVSLQSPKNKPSMLVVLKSCPISVEWVDKRQIDSDAQKSYLDERAQQSLAQGLDLSQAPVHRLLGVQTDADTTEFFWACHHLFLDGWSAVVLLKDLADLYSHESSGTPLPSSWVSSYGDYLKWKSNQPVDAARQFWSDYLDELHGPVSLVAQFSSAEKEANTSLNSHLEYVCLGTSELSQLIENTATTLKVTPATIVYASWAIFLAALTKSDDVVFGTTSAGRAFDLPDSHLMIGYFANVIPKRSRLNRSRTVSEHFAQCHKDGFSALAYEYVPVDEIQSWTNIPLKTPLFDNLVLFENLPQSDIEMQDTEGRVTIGSFSGGLTSMYPLTLTIQPGERWRFKYLYESHLQEAQLQSTLTRFPDFLNQVCSNIGQDVGQSYDWAVSQLAVGSNTLNKQSEGSNGADIGFQGARNKTELAIATIWESVLGTQDIDVRTEFIALGGRSIAAVRMLAQIEEKLGAKLSMLDLVTQPTIEALAKLIDGDSAKTHWRSLIPLKSVGDKPPVIFVHAVGSHALFLRSVTPYFEAEQSVIGLQLVGLDGECEPMDSISQISDHYLEEILSYEQNGPYYFVAHCLGAMVAHDIIVKLKKRGKQVAMFVVLDAQAPLLHPRETAPNRLRQMFRDPELSTWKSCVYIAKQLVLNVHYRISVQLNLLRQKILLKFGSALQKRQVRMEKVHAASHTGMYSYVGEPIDQKIVLIRSDRDANHLHLDWKHMTSELEIVVLPIGHETMFTEPEVAILGDTLNDLVNKAKATVEQTSVKSG